MKQYKHFVEKKAQKFLRKLPKAQEKFLIEEIKKLPYEGDIKALQGGRNKKAGYKRLRVGDFRIIYTQDDEKLIICAIDAGNRGDIYKRY